MVTFLRTKAKVDEEWISSRKNTKKLIDPKDYEGYIKNLR
jgi:hypothetical protein